MALAVLVDAAVAVSAGVPALAPAGPVPSYGGASLPDSGGMPGSSLNNLIRAERKSIPRHDIAMKEKGLGKVEDAGAEQSRNTAHNVRHDTASGRSDDAEDNENCRCAILFNQHRPCAEGISQKKPGSVGGDRSQAMSWFAFR